MDFKHKRHFNPDEVADIWLRFAESVVVSIDVPDMELYSQDATSHGKRVGMIADALTNEFLERFGRQ